MLNDAYIHEQHLFVVKVTKFKPRYDKYDAKGNRYTHFSIFIVPNYTSYVLT
jgi:hypothetical protein